eukprot:CAMPEP_0202906110 /NCGR_PEP_ID=MMETSP1392-20130828/37368_1 /ASSEMBLY_ACC=CAM_ASM_000868 /TAXON_ID=225041 /ORGANISM="Chlamydomonas chlamydogama, Strain SAG 11-48b" /LENGTH=105 /DNA_ID=CAMNT_0049594475 /DNA_START=822 /DNA_END=1139 /DNA_ORIENTATION=+
MGVLRALHATGRTTATVAATALLAVMIAADTAVGTHDCLLASPMTWHTEHLMRVRRRRHASAGAGAGASHAACGCLQAVACMRLPACGCLLLGVPSALCSSSATR